MPLCLYGAGWWWGWDHGRLGVVVTWGDVGPGVLLLVLVCGGQSYVFRGCISLPTECSITHAVCVSLLVITAAV